MGEQRVMIYELHHQLANLEHTLSHCDFFFPQYLGNATKHAFQLFLYFEIGHFGSASGV